jgi:hypothetical protein
MDKLLPTPEEVAEALGIGRTKVYEPIWIAALIMADGQRVVRRASSARTPPPSLSCC